MDKQKKQRQKRIRTNLQPSANRPRLSVFRSNKYCYAQIIDQNGSGICGVSEKALSLKSQSPMQAAEELGREIAKIALAKKVTAVVFDKGRFAYHGKVAAIAKGAREGGLQF
jgi:large subunit ribosomal protein L18